MPSDLLRRASMTLARKMSSNNLDPAPPSPTVAPDALLPARRSGPLVLSAAPRRRLDAAAPSPFLSSLESEHAALLARSSAAELPVPTPLPLTGASSADTSIHLSFHTDDAAVTSPHPPPTPPRNDAFGLEQLTDTDSDEEIFSLRARRFQPVSTVAKRSQVPQAPTAHSAYRRQSWDEDAAEYAAPPGPTPQANSDLSGSTVSANTSGPTLTPSNDPWFEQSAQIPTRSRRYLLVTRKNSQAAIRISGSIATRRMTRTRSHRDPDMQCEMMPAERMFPHLADSHYADDSRILDLFVFLHNAARAELRDLHAMLDAIRARVDFSNSALVAASRRRLRADLKSLQLWWRDTAALLDTVFAVEEAVFFNWLSQYARLDTGPFARQRRAPHMKQIRTRLGAVSRHLLKVNSAYQPDELVGGLASLLRCCNDVSASCLVYMDRVEQYVPKCRAEILSLVAKGSLEMEARTYLFKYAHRKNRKPAHMLAGLLRWTEENGNGEWTGGYLKGRRTRFMYNQVWKKAWYNGHLRHVEAVTRA